MSSSLHQIHNSPPTPDSTPHISANPGVNPGIQPWGFKEIISYNPVQYGLMGSVAYVWQELEFHTCPNKQRLYLRVPFS